MFDVEEWKDIGDAPGYQISSFGRIRSFRPVNGRGPLSKTPRYMTLNVGSKGYLQTNILYGGISKNVYPHRLVAQHFVENKSCYPVVNHLDGNKFNNIAGNLEWTSIKNNCIHAVKTGLSIAPKGENCGASRLTNKQASEILSAKGKVPQKVLAEKYGIGVKQVGKIHQRVQWVHIGGK